MALLAVVVTDSFSQCVPREEINIVQEINKISTIKNDKICASFTYSFIYHPPFTKDGESNQLSLQPNP